MVTSRTLTPADYAPVTQRRLKPADIKYLVFEGGGGKGFAYLGALKALADKNVLRYVNSGLFPPTADGQRHSKVDPRYIRGFGGASAGAITAFLLSIGYTPDELATLMGDKDKFLAFFDGGYNDPTNPQIQRLVPVFGGAPYVPMQDLPSEKRAKSALQYAGSFVGLESQILNFEKVIGVPYVAWLADLLDAAKVQIGAYQNTPPFDKLIGHWKDFVVNFPQDWGLFAGYAARQLFDKLLSDRMPLGQDGQPQKNVPFEAHGQFFNVELLVTGTNLLTGKVQVFSRYDTPWVPVADAVRISMGIPFVFKPIQIGKMNPVVAEHPELRGCWVDGGLLNNTPFREFDDRPGANPKTLALRLEVEPDLPDMQSIKDFMSSYMKLALMGPGEAYDTAAHAYQAVVLDTTGLSLLDFAPDPKAVKATGQAAYKTLNAYFTGNPNTPSYTAPVSSPN